MSPRPFSVSALAPLRFSHFCVGCDVTSDICVPSWCGSARHAWTPEEGAGAVPVLSSLAGPDRSWSLGL